MSVSQQLSIFHPENKNVQQNQKILMTIPKEGSFAQKRLSHDQLTANEFLPDEVIRVLQPLPSIPDRRMPPLESPTSNTTLLQIKHSHTSFNQLLSGKLASVWHNKGAQRDRLKHLTDKTICICGAGSDLSFLCDAKDQNSIAKSQSFEDLTEPENQTGGGLTALQKRRKKKQAMDVKLADKLMSNEFSFVQHSGIRPLEIEDSTYGVSTKNHETHMTVLPNLHPTNRLDVLRLQANIDQILQKAGLDSETLQNLFLSPLSEESSVMHNLIEISKKEQDLYNVIFFEIVRQCTVACLDRGELIGRIRAIFQSIFGNLPTKIHDLHNEIVAQKALDRRLTEELAKFKKIVDKLTSELSAVKQHQRNVLDKSRKSRELLQKALQEAKSNSDLLVEYQALYEIQRKRLEGRVKFLSTEKERWQITSYKLKIELNEAYELNDAVDLQILEKNWNEIGIHLLNMLSEADSLSLELLQHNVDDWAAKMREFAQNLVYRDELIIYSTEKIKSKIDTFRETFEETYIGNEGSFATLPNKEQTTEVLEFVIEVEQLLSKQIEVFGGEQMLQEHEKLKNIKRINDFWTELGLETFNRHRHFETGANYPDHDQMLINNQTIQKLSEQYNIRLLGENGTARCLIALQSQFEQWHARLLNLVNAAYFHSMPDTDWMRFYLSIEEWLESLSKAKQMLPIPFEEGSSASIRHLGTLKDDTVGPDDGVESELESSNQVSPVDILQTPPGTSLSQKKQENKDFQLDSILTANEVVNEVEKWSRAVQSGIQSENIKLTEMRIQLDTTMIQWLIQVVLRYAPDLATNSREAFRAARNLSAPPRDLQQTAHSLSQRIDAYTNYIYNCTNNVVGQATQKKRDLYADNAEEDLNKLNEFISSGQKWVGLEKKFFADCLKSENEAQELEKSEKKLRRMSADSSVSSSSATSHSKSNGSSAASRDFDSNRGAREGSSRPGNNEYDATVNKADRLDLTSSEDGTRPSDTEHHQHAAQTDPPNSKESVLKIEEENFDIQDLIVQSEEKVQPIRPTVNVQGVNTDLNARQRPLLQNPDLPQQDNVIPVEPDQELFDTGLDTQMAYRALAMLKLLQEKLDMTEMAAQDAESQAVSAELSLMETEEWIENVKKRLERVRMEIGQTKFEQDTTAPISDEIKSIVSMAVSKSTTKL